MSEIAALLNRPVEVEVGGVRLRFSRLNDRIRLALEEWAEGVVTTTYERLSTRAPDDVARQRLFGEYEKVMTEHRYAFGKPDFLALMNTLEGVAVAATLLLEANHPGVTRDEVVELLSLYPSVGETLTASMSGDSKKNHAATPTLAVPTAAT